MHDDDVEPLKPYVPAAHGPVQLALTRPVTSPYTPAGQGVGAHEAAGQ